MALRFGDRISASSLRLLASRRAAYFRSLEDYGFEANEPIYRYFGGEVFHDSEVSISSVSPNKKTLCLKMRNIYAIDKVSNLLKDSSRRIDNRDFRTTIKFDGIADFRMSLKRLGNQVLYYASEISRFNDSDSVTIELRDARGNSGFISIRFKKVVVEDILPTLRKYLRTHKDDATIVTWIMHQPGLYASKWLSELKP